MRYIYLIILVISSLALGAQTEAVMTKFDGENISIKWFPEELVNSEGYNIFRAEEGTSDFVMINENPIKLEPSQSNALNEEDQVFVQFASKLMEGEEDPFVKFYVMMKVLSSNDFAKFVGLQYDDNEIEIGKSYLYRVERVSGANATVGTSKSVSTLEVYTLAPPVDAKLAFQSQGRNTFIWKPETDRYFGVNVYRKGIISEAWQKLNDAPIVPSKAIDELGILRYQDFFYEDTTITKESYKYTFTSLGVFGDESEKSAVVEVTSLDRRPPASASNFSVISSDQGNVLNWTASRSRDLAGYNVVRSINGDTTFYQINDQLLQETSFIDPVLDAATYKYFVQSIDLAGNTSLSEMKFVIVSDLTAPDNPTNLTVTVDPGAVKLAWESDKPGDFWGYKVLRSSVENPRDEDFQLIIPEPLQEKNFVDILAGEAEMALYYAVVAVDTFNNESEWLISEKVMTPDTVSPTPPVIVNVSSEDETVNIQWIASPDLDVVGYQVYRCEKKDMNWVSLDEDLGADALTFSDKDPIQGEMLCYKVVAKDDAGNISPASNLFTIKSKSKDISGEQRINLSGSKYRKNKNQVELKWEGDKDFQYRGYMVFRSENDGKLSPASALLTTTTYEDKSIQENVNYQYQIKAYTDKGVVLISNIQTITIK